MNWVQGLSAAVAMNWVQGLSAAVACVCAYYLGKRARKGEVIEIRESFLNAVIIEAFAEGYTKAITENRRTTKAVN